MEPLQTLEIQEQFVLWLRTVSYAFKQLKAQQEKLQYFNVKLLGYQGVGFGQIKVKQVKGNPWAHWLEKIGEVEEKIKETKELLREYDEFMKLLKKDEVLILERSLSRKTSMSLLAEEMEISRTTLYTIKNGIIDKWYPFHQEWLTTHSQLDT